MQEMVPVMMHAKGGQVWRLLTEVDAPEAIFSVKLTEACSSM